VARVHEVKGGGPLESEESSTAQRYQDELNALIAERSDVATEALSGSPQLSPFDEMYRILVDNIVAASNTYVTLRIIEDMITGEQ